jgi:signal transduction histidine kinase
LKYFLFFLVILSASLFAKNNVSIESFMLYKTMDKSLTLEEIKERNNLFTAISKENTLISSQTVSWIKIKLNVNIPSGKYFVSYNGFEFDISSFLIKQKLTKYISNTLQVYSFEYDRKSDSQSYYFKLINVKHYKNPSLQIQLFDKYYQQAMFKPDSKEFYLLFGIIVGFMFMVSTYNLAIFYFHRENAFLYYSMMQFFMITIMIYQFGISSLDIFLYNLVTLLSSIFATLFMRSFLDTPKYLPILNKILIFYLILLFLDIVHLIFRDYSVMSYFGLYSIFGIIYFILGYLRFKQGFIPAKFFLMGWTLLVFSIFITEHIGDIYGISPFLFGPPLESILLSIALAYRLKLSLDEKKEQQELLVHQSKLASMGEMIGNIAHQWKQPLTYLSYNFMNLREVSKRNLLDDNYLKKKLDKADMQLEFMSQTIDNFRDFYLPNKKKELFSVEKASLETLEIMDYPFKQHDIEVIMDVKNDMQMESYKNEYKQVLLNLLTNAKDVFIQRKINAPKIIISIDKNCISVLDNAGGIPEEVLPRIYEPYFTTKTGNSGIGLYMSKMIIEKDMEGELRVENYLEGALFKICFK